jgi:4-hydroxy-tetrahydrodipicolinate synthase
MLERFPGWGIFCGNETRLVDAMQLGARGTISATCNVNAAKIAELCRDWQGGDAARKQEQANRVRGVVAKYPMIPALKALVGRVFDDVEWGRMRPPLTELTADQRQALFADIDAVTAVPQSVPA